eukprot:15452423-Alexandrium_andersonii.AAC.1
MLRSPSDSGAGRKRGLQSNLDRCRTQRQQASAARRRIQHQHDCATPCGQGLRRSNCCRHESALPRQGFLVRFNPWMG